MKKIENWFWSLLKMWRSKIRSLSIDWRISRWQLWISDMILRFFLTLVFFIDMVLFKMPILVFVILLMVIIKTIFLLVQRMNDLDFSPNRLLAALWLIIFALIFQNIYTTIFLIIFVVLFQITLYAVVGTDWSNQNGEDPLKSQPKTNEKYYMIVWFLLFLILFIGSIITFFLWWLELIWFWWN